MHSTPASAQCTVATASGPIAPVDASLLEAVCARIAPTWPLDRFIAVNPLWGRIDQPLETAASEIASLSGSRLLMPRAWYREQWRAGRFGHDDLRNAALEAGHGRDVDHYLKLLQTQEAAPLRRARITDIADDRATPPPTSWCDFVIQDISQFCAAYFDERQALIAPDRERGLYASWLRHAREDRSPALVMGLHGYRELARELPTDVRELIGAALRALDVSSADQQSYLEGLLLDISGWSAWCAYLRWTARLAGREDERLVELLAIRLAWEWLLLRAGGKPLASRWQMAMAKWAPIDRAARVAQRDDWVLQRALELAYQREIGAQLLRTQRVKGRTGPEAQVAFCIDVRSEVFRRALEIERPAVQTLGFAGFFGLPAEYAPIDEPTTRPHLPGLIPARLRITDTGLSSAASEQCLSRLGTAAGFGLFKRSGISGFSFVEALGPLYGLKLLSDSLGYTAPGAEKDRVTLSRGEHARRKPRLTGSADGQPLDLESVCNTAVGILRAMSLTHDFAPIVALIGHGSQTVNNPRAAGLDCGACCGQTGEVSARAVAAMLNDVEVRRGVAARGVHIPPATWFVPGLHNTTTDEVVLLDLDEVPTSHRDAVAQLAESLRGAGETARAERARRLSQALTPESAALVQAARARARDWAETRPEWGLANNAAFIVAPRERTRGLNLHGRSFLHDYRWQEDTSCATLELIMTAPMVVTHWINFQYYASTVDNARYGSGNKVLHNVVGGHLGVFEGNGGDLRIGLPLQSLHDGVRWVHTPLRLSVFIEAPRQAVEQVMQKHAVVRQLVENGWVHLLVLDPTHQTLCAYQRGTWSSLLPSDADR